jgi:hypothetical protein
VSGIHARFQGTVAEAPAFTVTSFFHRPVLDAVVDVQTPLRDLTGRVSQ